MLRSPGAAVYSANYHPDKPCFSYTSKYTPTAGHCYQVRVQPFLNGRPFKNQHVFIDTRKTLPASAYKHQGLYKRSAIMTG